MDHSSSVKSNISEAGFYNITPNISFVPPISARCFIFLLFQPMGVSEGKKKSLQHTLKVSANYIKSTTHQILCLGGSSIP
jgi:hypothetical protein